MLLFQNLQRILGGSESVEFTVRRHAKGLEVIVTSTLKEAPTDLSDEDAEFRGALAMPLYACDDAGALDEKFFAQLAKYADARESLANTCGAIDTLREAGQQAKVTQKKLSKDNSAKEPKSGDDTSDDSSAAERTEEAVPKPSADTKANPGSLF